MGSGVMQFINEPRKAILDNDTNFKDAMKKGMKSLVRGFVGESLGLVSKLTGSL